MPPAASALRGPFVRIQENRTVGSTQFQKGQAVFAHEFQQALEAAGMLDSVKYTRPVFHCIECDQPVRFRRKAVSETGPTRAATFTANREDHQARCLFSRSSKEVRAAQNGGTDLGDPERDFATHLTEPKKGASTGNGPMAGVRGGGPVEGGGALGGEELPPGEPRNRHVRNHPTSELAVVVASYVAALEKYPDVRGDREDPVVREKRQQLRTVRDAALRKMELVLPGNKKSSYKGAFFYLLAQQNNLESMGNKVWYAKIGKVLICTDGLIVLANANSEALHLRGGAVLRMEPGTVQDSLLLAEVKEALSFYVFGSVKEQKLRGEMIRLVTPKHLSWFHAGEHPWWGYGKVEFEETHTTIDLALTPPPPLPVPSPDIQVHRVDPPQVDPPSPSVPEEKPAPKAAAQTVSPAFSAPPPPRPKPAPASAPAAPPPPVKLTRWQRIRRFFGLE